MPNPPASAARSPSTPRTASEALKRRWPKGKTDFALYADLEGTARTPLFAALKFAAFKGPGAQMVPLQKDCVEALSSSSRELAIARSGQRQLTLLRFEPNGLSPTPETCLTKAFKLERTPLPGAGEAYAFGSDLLIVDSGWIMSGPKELVITARAAAESATAWPSSLDLAEHQYAGFTFDIDGKAKGDGRLKLTPDRLLLDVRAQMPEERLAVQAERELLTLLSAPGVEKALPNKPLKLERKGSTLLGSFEIGGNPTEQAAALSMVAAAAIGNVRSYIQDAKQAEARNTVGQIAKAYVMSVITELKAKATKKLFSLPAVPKLIPRGTKYQSSRAEWQPWNRIGFSFADPQYYQYEVTAKPDGKFAEVIARGDLDGDGKHSEFSLQLKIDGDEVLVAPEMNETDPAE